MRYLSDKKLPAYKDEARRLKCKAAHYFLIQETLYRMGSISFIWNIWEVIKLSMSRRYMKKFAVITRKYNRWHRKFFVKDTIGLQCRRMPRKWWGVTEMLKVHQDTYPTLREINGYVLPLAFTIWSLDLINLLPIGRGQAKYALVAMDYFMKWAEAKLVTSITNRKTMEFIRRRISSVGLTFPMP